MTRNISFAVIVLVGAVGLFASLYHHSRYPYPIPEFLKHPASTEWTAAATAILPELVAGTRFQDRWRLNALPSDGMLTLILTDSNTWDAPERYRQNCGYDQRTLVILCDVAFIENFLTRQDLDKEIIPFKGDRPIEEPFELRRADAATIEQRRRHLLIWVIGHEIGHAVLGHGSAHFTSDRLNDPTFPRSLSQEMEVAADAYLLARIDGSTEKEWGFYAFLVHVLQNEIRQKVCSDRSPLQYCPRIQYGAGLLYPDVILHFSSHESHPEYLIRLLRLINLGNAKYDFGLIGYEAQQIINYMVQEKSTSHPVPR